MSECWRFYAVPTARVIFTVKTSLDFFSLSREQVWTFSVLGDQIYKMRCPFVAVGLNVRFKVLPHWDNMSQALCFVVPTSSYVPCKQGPPPFLKSLVLLAGDVVVIWAAHCSPRISRLYILDICYDKGSTSLICNQ